MCWSRTRRCRPTISPELITLAKSKPETLTFGSSGYATASYMAAELFNANAGTAIVMVPYQGGSNQALSDLLSGRITLMFNVAATLAPHVAAGKLKAFAVAQGKRASILPDVPTLAEAGMTGYDAGVWIGLLAPRGRRPRSSRSCRPPPMTHCRRKRFALH